MFLGRLFAAGMRALFALSNSLVAAVSRVLLALLTEFVFPVRLNATFMLAFFALSFGLDATALACHCVGTKHEDQGKSASGQDLRSRHYRLSCLPSLVAAAWRGAVIDLYRMHNIGVRTCPPISRFDWPRGLRAPQPFRAVRRERRARARSYFCLRPVPCWSS
jgi:hypothetical protein